MNIKEPLIFGKQKLVLNSAKNKYDYYQEEYNDNIQNNNEDMKSLDSFSFNSSYQTLRLSSAETRVSSIRYSKESINSFGTNQSYLTFLGEKNKNEKNYEPNCNIFLDNHKSDLEMEIKNSLRKLSEQYFLNSNKGYLFNYYCSPFIYNLSCKNDLFFLNKYKEVLNDNNIYKDCPFEYCKDK